MSADSFPKDLAPEQFDRLRDIIHRTSGIHVDDSRLDALRISLVARATRLGFRSLDEYLQLLASDAHEQGELLELVTINETSFFRFPQQFEVLRTRVLPEFAADPMRGGAPPRIWSAGCSTGEEPYSIAITLADAGFASHPNGPFVLGTDVSRRALAHAREAVYGKRAVINVPPEVRERHFETTDDGLRVAAPVRALVTFREHNLVADERADPAMTGWDVIFCRNVTIYFREESTRRVIARFFDALADGGYLFVGHSETLADFETPFEVIETGGVFVYRKQPLRVRERAKTGVRTAPKRVADAQTTGPRRRPAALRPAGAGGGVDDHLAAAHAHADAGRLDDAIAACERALAADPLAAGPRYLLAVVLQRQGETERALEELRRTVYADADFALAYLSLANMHKARRDWEAAAREYANALAALARSPEGSWTAYLGGFRIELLAASCERSLEECRTAAVAMRHADR